MLNVKSWKHSPKLNLCRYQSVGDYLGHGSPISMSDSEIRCKKWSRYKNAMKDLLTDPKTAPWLGGPIDLDWSDSRYYRLCERDRKEGDGATCVSDLKRRFVLTVVVGIVLFWIPHIISALGFLILKSTSGYNGQPMAELQAHSS